MPKPALSLLGYLQKEQAFEYLKHRCLLDDSSPRALEQLYEDAVSRLGSVAIDKAGDPEILPIPSIHQRYMHDIKTSAAAKVLEGRGAIAIQLVEISPLIAFQLHVELDRAESFFQADKTIPTVGEMLPKCLPIENESILVEMSMPLSPNSWMVRTPNLNVRCIEGGLFPIARDNYLGVKIGSANPLVQVYKFRGKAYLVNGYHRAYSLGRQGVKHLPCILQEVQSLDEIANLGISLQHLQSDNPPTVGHFLHDRAYPILLRNYKKSITVTLSEHLCFEE